MVFTCVLGAFVIVRAAWSDVHKINQITSKIRNDWSIARPQAQ